MNIFSWFRIFHLEYLEYSFITQVVNFTENLKNGFEFFFQNFLMTFMRISKLKFSPCISLMGTTSLDWACAYDEIEYERMGKVRIFSENRIRVICIILELCYQCQTLVVTKTSSLEMSLLLMTSLRASPSISSVLYRDAVSKCRYPTSTADLTPANISGLLT